MAMEVQGTRRPQDAGVKVKFIETQFISSDAASFKAVVQRLTGKSPAASSQTTQPPAHPQPQSLRPCRPTFIGAGQQQTTGWTDLQAAGGYLATMPAPKQEHLAAAPRLEDMNELCDFADLFYTTAASTRPDGGASVFPY